MDKKYNITTNKELKFNSSYYKVAPERRFEEHTEEWKRRLEKEQPMFSRRNPKKTQSYEVKDVIPVIVIIMFLLLIVF